MALPLSERFPLCCRCNAYGALLAASILPFSTSRADGAQTPNIVFVLADDLGYGDLGVTGQLARAQAGLPAISTPHLDALAAQSVSFTNMQTAPICSASRASLLTGFGVAHSIFDRATHESHLRAEDVTWGEVLKDAGYATAMYGKWHVGGVLGTALTNVDATPTHQGFDTVYGTLSGGYRNQWMWQDNGAGDLELVRGELEPSWTGPGGPRRFTDDVVTDRVKSFIREKAADSEPFAAYVALQAPHAPLDQFPILAQYADMSWPTAQKQYASMITHLDENVQQILNALDDPNGDGNPSDSVAENTLFIFASDNGPLWPGGVAGYTPDFFDSNGVFKSFKASTDQGGVQIPFFARLPGVTEPGAVNSSHVGSLADILPTLAELAGQQAPLGIDGESMAWALRGESGGREADAQATSYPQSFASFNLQGWSLRVGDWKLTFRNSTGTTLYNLANDPGEANNLSANRADIVDALQTIALEEGLGREPILPHVDFPAIGVTVNDYYAQYKSWAPVAGSTSFYQAANWSGGTANIGAQPGLPGIPEAQNWNSGPADNWIARVRHSGPGAQSILLTSDVDLLAMEVAASQGSMEVVVPAGVELTMRNGLRIADRGRLSLQGGKLVTVKRVEILEGGELVGGGVITGRQQVIAGIPEFQGKGLFEPEVDNAGSLVIQSNSSSAAVLRIEGDYVQGVDGALRIDLVGSGGAPGVDFDRLEVVGRADLAGLLAVTLGPGFTPLPGVLFPIVTASHLTVQGLALGGSDGYRFAPSLGVDNVLRVEYFDADFNLDGQVDQADLATMTQSLGLGSTTHAQGDANKNGRVDGRDFLAWERSFGHSMATLAQVPEPRTFLLSMSGLLFMKRVRCKRSAT